MPILAAYFGVSTISVLIYHDEETYEFLKFPYAYSEEVYSNYTNEEEFNNAVLESLLKPKRKKLSGFDVIAAGYLTEPQLPFKAKMLSTTPVLLNSVERMNPILVTTWGVSVREKAVARSTVNYNVGSEEISVFADGLDFFSSLSLYPQISPLELSTRAHIDQEITDFTKDDSAVLYEEYPLVFTGDRFSQYTVNEELDYIFILGFVNKSGVYDVYMDRQNAMILYQLLKTYSKDNSFILEDNITDVGTLISTTGYTECILKKEIGTTQLMEVNKNEIFVVPIERDMKGTLVVKNHELGTIEKNITGGSMGIIFDTREYKKSVASDIKMFNSSLKQFDRILKGIHQ